MIFGTIVLCLIILSHLPQYYKIISAGNSDGIDHRYLFLSVVGASFAWNRGLLDIADDLDKPELFKILQLTFQLINLILFYALFVTFYNDNIRLEQGYAPIVRNKVLIWVGIAVVLIVILFCVSISSVSNNWSGYYSETLGVLFVITSVFKYVPQIYLTYQTRIIGSFCPKSLALQILSMFLMPIFMSQHFDVVTWTPYLIVCFVQFGYLVMIYHINKEQRQYSLLETV